MTYWHAMKDVGLAIGTADLAETVSPTNFEHYATELAADYKRDETRRIALMLAEKLQGSNTNAPEIVAEYVEKLERAGDR
ncbi:MAG: hypothetical protein HN368_23950 [Spirochaetales bacterium]|nr:hypothetical protein [Spirochaetales bacterium]